MIKFIVNGYYRSGTTYLYEEIKSSNNQLGVFYEPTSHSLSSFMFRKNGNFKMHSKYKYDMVGSAYKKLDIDCQLQLLRNNPFIGNLDLPTDIQVKSYLELFQTLDFDCVLQTNNLHFHLGYIANELDIPIVHLVRDPIDVWKSVLAVPKNRSSKSKDIIKSLINLFNYNLPFNLSTEYEYIQKRFNPVDADNRSWKSKLGLRPAFEVFVKVWIESNYQAVKHCVNNPNALLLSFDELLSSEYGLSQEKLSWFDSHKIKFDKKIERKIKNNTDDQLLSRKLREILNRCDLEDKYMFIKKHVAI